MHNLQLVEELIDKKNVTDLVLDTTGLKVYGEGEWCAKRYGGKSKWIKLHVAVDLRIGKLLLAEETGEIYKERNQALRAIKGLGGDERARTIWGKLSGYSEKVIVESKISALCNTLNLCRISELIFIYL